MRRATSPVKFGMLVAGPPGPRRGRRTNHTCTSAHPRARLAPWAPLTCSLTS